MSAGHVGDFALTDTTAVIEFNTFSSDNPSASVTVTELATGDIFLHKDGAAAAGTPGGKTLRLNVGSVNGNHLIVLDLTNTADAGFYANGSHYSIRLKGISVDGGELNVWVGSFSIGKTVSKATGDATLVDTNELQGDWEEGGRLDLKLDAAGSVAGAGAATVGIYSKTASSVAIPGVDVWISTDASGATVVAGTLVSDAGGLTTFYLDPGTYYTWRQLSGYTFTNPQTTVVAETADFTYTDGVAAEVGSGESTLSVGFPELKQEVGIYLGLGGSGWASAVETRIEALVQSGVRQVYYPPAIADDTLGHEWSWLRPNTTISISAPYATGTVTVAAGVVTLVDGVFPSWTAGSQFNTNTGTYTVDTRDGDTQATLTDLTAAADAGSSYSVVRLAYDLPDDFNRLVGMLHFPTNEYRDSIQLVSVSRILQLRASYTYDSTPRWAATRYKASTRQTGQRQEIMFYPNPEQAWTLQYEYEAYSGILSDSYPYTLGGMHLAELFIESCLAVAELRVNRENDIHNEQFRRLLIDAVSRDKGRAGRNFGQMGHREEYIRKFRRGYTGGTYPITYQGNDI